MANLKPWLAKREIQSVKVSSKDLQNLLDLVARDLGDAQVVAVSTDRRFANAYAAALNLASYVIRKEGYRVVGQRGHHRTTFIIAGKILGREAAPFLDFFDFCRRKRNQVDYDFAHVVSETEVKELIETVLKFRELVESNPSR